MAGKLPRFGFLQESRSAPSLGPPLGRAHSPRFEPPKITIGRDVTDAVYDLPEVDKYRSVKSACTTRVGPGLGKQVGPRIDPTLMDSSGAGPNKYYDWPLQGSESAPTLGPGLGRQVSARDCDLVPPGAGADVQYDLPSVDKYRPRLPAGALHWDAKRPRFDPPHKLSTDKVYDVVDFNVYRSQGSACVTRIGPGLGKQVGPRIDPTLFGRIGDGTDSFYDLPSVQAYKERSSSFRFAYSPHSSSAPSLGSDGGALTPTKMPSARAPPWVGRLTSYTPRDRNPWAKGTPAPLPAKGKAKGA